MVLFHVAMTQPNKNQDKSPPINPCWRPVKGVDRTGPPGRNFDVHRASEGSNPSKVIYHVPLHMYLSVKEGLERQYLSPRVTLFTDMR
jgi:hypothetical protein